MSDRPKQLDEELLARTPTLRNYLIEQDANQKSISRFVIYGDGAGYNNMGRVVGTITLTVDGDIVTTGQAEPPDDARAAMIKGEVGAAGWPASALAGHRASPSELAGVAASHLFRFLSRDGQHTILIQQRVDFKDGSKIYLPWSYWTDGKWRRAEPEGLLPLYGLDQLTKYPGVTVFLHEGAKAARHVRWMVDAQTREAKEALAACPWGPELSHAVHLGWIGGADNPLRTDWQPLRQLSPDTEIIVVADNDSRGLDAVSTISRALRHKMSMLAFDDAFRKGFDLAEPWPQHTHWWEGKRYIGPTFHDHRRPATWATTKMEPDGQGRPSFELRDDFADRYYVSKSPHLIAHRDYPILLTPEVFNRTIAPFSHVEDTARLLVKKVSVHADTIAYRPQRRDAITRMLTEDGQRKINTYRPPTIRPAFGDPGPFLRYLDCLVPAEHDRTELMRWIATLIARPSVRMRYGVLLISETQGVGKTTLGEGILAPLLGRWNISTPNEQQIDSAFNGWVAHKRLAIISEIYSGERRKTYDRLKAVITDDTVEVNQKYLEPYSIENWCHVLACSNSLRALHIDHGDRRWLTPEITEVKQPVSYWQELYGWLNSGGLPIVAQWADDFLLKNPAVNTGDHSPATEAKNRVIAESRSEGQKMAHDLAADAIQTGKQIVLTVNEVRDWVGRARGLTHSDYRLEKPLTLRRVLLDAGLREPQRLAGRQDNRMKINGTWQNVVATFDIEPGTTWTQLTPYHCKPDDIAAM